MRYKLWRAINVTIWYNIQDTISFISFHFSKRISYQLFINSIKLIHAQIRYTNRYLRTDLIKSFTILNLIIQLRINVCKVISNIFWSNFFVNSATKGRLLTSKMSYFFKNIALTFENAIKKLVVLDCVIASFEAPYRVTILILAVPSDCQTSFQKIFSSA